jgi:TrkA-N domain
LQLFSSIKGFFQSIRASWMETVLRFFRNYEWSIIAGLWIASLCLGFWGFSLYFEETKQTRSVWDTLYVTLQLYTMESGSVSGEPVHWQLELARLLAPAATLYTALAAFALVFREQLQILTLKLFKNHVVICGLGRRGMLLAKAFRDRGRRVVVIDKDGNNDCIDQTRENGITVLIGDATDKEMLVKAHVQEAEVILSVCGEDGVNAEVAVDARNLASDRRGNPLKCVVSIDDLELVQLLKVQELAMGRAVKFRMEFFNPYIRGARAMLEEHPPFRHVDRPSHILVIGMGRFGQSVVLQAARLWRRARCSQSNRMRVTTIDKASEDRKRLMVLRTPTLESVCDIRTLEMDVQSAAFYRAEFLHNDKGQCDIGAVYVCLDEDSRALATALTLMTHLRSHDVPIVTRMAHEGGLTRLIKGTDGTRQGFGNLHAFGFLDRTCDPDLVLGGIAELLARAYHANRVEKTPNGVLKASKDSATVSWNRLRGRTKEVFRRHADKISIAIVDMGYAVGPVTDLNSGVQVLSEEQVEALAGRLYGLERTDPHDTALRKALVYESRSLDISPKAPSWNESPEETRQVFRKVSGELSGILAQDDLCLSQLDSGRNH